MEDLPKVEVVDVSTFLYLSRDSVLIRIIRREPTESTESRQSRLWRKPRQYAFFFLQTRPHIEFIVSLAGEKPGFWGKAKHMYQEYQDIKGGSGGNQQGGGGYDQYQQGGGDDLF